MSRLDDSENAPEALQSLVSEIRGSIKSQYDREKVTDQQLLRHEMRMDRLESGINAILKDKDTYFSLFMKILASVIAGGILMAFGAIITALIFYVKHSP